MDFEYIIVQAGGKGTRLDYLTRNKPKALVSVDNLPMIFHLFRLFPNKKFIIIGDYKIDVIKKYMSVFSTVSYIIVDAQGKPGTCGGIQSALKLIPEDAPFLLIWSDLILSEKFTLPQKLDNYIGLTNEFMCRWIYENGVFSESPSDTNGVAGFFLFKNPLEISNVPYEGEFVRWLCESKKDFSTFNLTQIKEYGVLSEYQKIKPNICRPFNEISEHDGKLVKKGIDATGKELAIKERMWYKKANEYGFKKIPEIYKYEPLVMEKVEGKNIFDYDLTFDEKLKLLEKIVDLLKSIHALESTTVDHISIQEAYVYKTWQRLKKVREIIPFSDKSYININGKKCPNIYIHWDKVEAFFEKYSINQFSFIHGDPTFSNIMLKNSTEPVLIDPRGYFGNTLLFGDEHYDYAKLYYSIKGNYDRFNRKEFNLSINPDGVELSVHSNNWDMLEEHFFSLLPERISQENIKWIHAVIWLSLTTYAWDDFDSICGAFYNGLYYLEELL